MRAAVREAATPSAVAGIMLTIPFTGARGKDIGEGGVTIGSV